MTRLQTTTRTRWKINVEKIWSLPMHTWKEKNKSSIMGLYTPNVIKNNSVAIFWILLWRLKKMFFSNLYFSTTDNIMQKKSLKQLYYKGMLWRYRHNHHHHHHHHHHHLHGRRQIATNTLHFIDGSTAR